MRLLVLSPTRSTPYLSARLPGRRFFSSFFSITPRPPRSTLFPYTTLFRSLVSSYWQVALGGVYTLDQVVIYNRSDGIGSRLSNFRVSVLQGGSEVYGQNFFTGTGSVQIGRAHV